MSVKKLIMGLGILLGLMLIPTLTAATSTTPPNIVVLTSDNAISVAEEITPSSVAEIAAKIREADARLSKNIFGASRQPIYLVMRTPGGSIQAGLEFIDILKGFDRPIKTITIFAASMGFQIVESMEERLIVRNGILMSHHANGGFEGDFGGQRPSQLDSRYNFWLQRLQELDAQTVSRTRGKQTMETYLKAYNPELWLTGTQAVEQGYADRVVTARCDKTISGADHKTLDLMGLAEVGYDLSRCPIITGPMNVKIKIATTGGKMEIGEFAAKGGMFGAACLATSGVDKTRLCALDTSLTPQRLDVIKAEFVNRFRMDGKTTTSDLK